MVQIQIISKILETQDYSLIENYQLTEDFFVGYEDEYRFIKGHVEEYGNVPDKLTFLEKFPQTELVECTETDRYLVNTIREENLYYKQVPVMKKVAELMQSDANAALEYMKSQSDILNPTYEVHGVDIVSQAKKRLKAFQDRKASKDKWFFSSGFPELDKDIHGLQRGEELFVIVARTNQGKSWVLATMCQHVWKQGFSVGYFSPEMSDDSIGNRFDTINAHFSNTEITWGSEDFDEEKYLQYLEELSKNENKFIVTTPRDFGHDTTVSKLRQWVKSEKLDLLAIDGIKYLRDERGNKNDNITTTLTNISEDLMDLSIELSIPILVVVQANRTGVIEKGKSDAPELDSIRDSDGIAYNATKVISINQKSQGVLTMIVKKQRNGKVGGKFIYDWDIDHGEFVYNANEEDEPPQEDVVKPNEDHKTRHKDSQTAYNF